MPTESDWIRLTDIYHAVKKNADGRVVTECGRWTESAEEYESTSDYPGMHQTCARCSFSWKQKRTGGVK